MKLNLQELRIDCRALSAAELVQKYGLEHYKFRTFDAGQEEYWDMGRRKVRGNFQLFSEALEQISPEFDMRFIAMQAALGVPGYCEPREERYKRSELGAYAEPQELLGPLIPAIPPPTREVEWFDDEIETESTENGEREPGGDDE